MGYLNLESLFHSKFLLDTLIKSANASEIVKAKFIIWIFTLIAASDIKLRGLGRELWKELSNGFDEIESHYEVMCQAFGKQLFIEKVREYPAGFSPKKEKPNKKATPSNIESQLEELQQLYKKKLITKEALTNMQLELLKEKIK